MRQALHNVESSLNVLKQILSRLQEITEWSELRQFIAKFMPKGLSCIKDIENKLTIFRNVPDKPDSKAPAARIAQSMDLQQSQALQDIESSLSVLAKILSRLQEITERSELRQFIAKFMPKGLSCIKDVETKLPVLRNVNVASVPPASEVAEDEVRSGTLSLRIKGSSHGR